MIHEDDFNLAMFRETAPSFAVEKIEYYILKFQMAKGGIKETVLRARQMQKEGMTRKEIYQELQRVATKYIFYGMKALDCDMAVDELVRKQGGGEIPQTR